MAARRWRPKDRLGERGAVGIMAAVGGALACIIAGVVIDTASIAYEARRYQGAADLAALAAAANIRQASAVADATARANVPTALTVVSRTGLYTPDPAVAPAARFSTTVPPGDLPNAAQVTVTGRAPLYFGRLLLGRDSISMTRTGLAALPRRDPVASFSLGSRLASLNGGLANQVLGALTGSEVKLSVMDYNGLAGADINLLSFVDALSVKAGLRVGDYEGLLNAEVSTGDALKIVEHLTNGADSGLQKLVQAVGDVRVKVGDLIGADVLTEDGIRGGLDVNVSALDLATAMIEIGAGDRHARLETGVRAGLADVDVWLAIGERPNQSPWLSVSKDGQPIIRTAQTRLYVEVRTTQALAGLAQVRLPLLVELASSEARLTEIDCNPTGEVTLAVRPGIARIRIGSIDTSKLNDFRRALTVQPALLVSLLGLVTVSGSADIEAASAQATSVKFLSREIDARTTKTVRATGFTSGTVASLLGRLRIDVTVIGLGLGLGDLTSALAALLAPLGPVLDGLVDGLLSTLGLSLGEADVTVHGVSCGETGTPVLVG